MEVDFMYLFLFNLTNGLIEYMEIEEAEETVVEFWGDG